MSRDSQLRGAALQVAASTCTTTPMNNRTDHAPRTTHPASLQAFRCVASLEQGSDTCGPTHTKHTRVPSACYSPENALLARLIGS